MKIQYQLQTEIKKKLYQQNFVPSSFTLKSETMDSA
jgi:hypothetical protein